MPQIVSVPLTEPIVVDGRKIEAVVLRAPNGREFLTLGSPASIGRTLQGGASLVRHAAILHAYVRACSDLPEGALAEVSNAGDAAALHDAMLSLFPEQAFLPAPPLAALTASGGPR